MNDLYFLIYIILFISVLFNIILIILYFKTPKDKLKNKESKELQDFMIDLMQGEGLVKVTRVDPSNVLLRSPRGR